MLGGILKKKINKGETVFGTFVKMNSPGMVEILGYGGFDFMIVDGEHSSFSYLDIENLVRAGDGVGLSSIIRLPRSSEEHILHALDSGADGIQIPGLSFVEEVKEALSYTKYYPEGKRGFSLAQRAAKYGLAEKNSYMKVSNEGTCIVVHIESTTMAAQVEELCKIPQLDVLFVGPGDLSQSMGKPGELNNPEVVKVIEKIFSTAAQYQKTVGIYVGNRADLEKYVKMGAKYIAWQSDVNMYTNMVNDTSKLFPQFREI